MKVARTQIAKSLIVFKVIPINNTQDIKAIVDAILNNYNREGLI